MKVRHRPIGAGKRGLMRPEVKSQFDLHGLSSAEFPDTIYIGNNMSGLEADPSNYWFHVALAELQRFQNSHGRKIASGAFIGSANGIDVLAALRLFDIKSLVVTDILPEILPTIERNIRGKDPRFFALCHRPRLRARSRCLRTDLRQSSYHHGG